MQNRKPQSNPTWHSDSLPTTAYFPGQQAALLAAPSGAAAWPKAALCSQQPPAARCQSTPALASRNNTSLALTLGRRQVDGGERRVRLQAFSIQFLFSEVWKSKAMCLLHLGKTSFKNRQHHSTNMVTPVSINDLDKFTFIQIIFLLPIFIIDFSCTNRDYKAVSLHLVPSFKQILGSVLLSSWCLYWN